jgi:hypothetical protein
MPGIAMDGSEDLPNRFISDQPTHLGMCPFCYEVATHMAKDMVGTRFCRNGHKWPHAHSLLAIPSNARPRKAPAENCIYGRCPTCDEPGVIGARDIAGTSWCKNDHEWTRYPRLPVQQTEQKPLATEQKPVYDSSHAIKLAKEIENVVVTSAGKARDDAAYGGSHGDGGASRSIELLKYWLDGIEFAQTGKTTVYKSLAQKIEQEKDPDYAEWLRLNEKFAK